MHVRFVVFRKIDSIITRTRAFDIFNKLIIVLSKEIQVDSPSIGWISYTIFTVEWMYRYGQQIEIIRPVLVFISFSFFFCFSVSEEKKNSKYSSRTSFREYYHDRNKTINCRFEFNFYFAIKFECVLSFYILYLSFILLFFL